MKCLECGARSPDCRYCTRGRMTAEQAARWHAEREGRPAPSTSRVTIWRSLLTREEGSALRRDQSRGLRMSRIWTAVSKVVGSRRWIFRRQRA